MSQKQNEHVEIFIEEELESNTYEDFDMSQFISNMDFHDDLMVPHLINYGENYTVKELLLICDYYGIAKQLKMNKCKKDEIIQILYQFESDSNNEEIVFKRKNMWFYINELKNDKFMKKYVLW